MPAKQPRVEPSDRKNVRRVIYRHLATGLAVGALIGLTTSNVFADGLVSYTVQPGDTLLAVARLYGTSADQIASWSGLSDPNALEVGQNLTVPMPGGVGPFPAPAPVPAPPPPAPAASIISAPYYSQFDGSEYGPSNCGPTSLSMALGAVGIDAAQMQLRHWADVQMGTNDPDNGTSWEALAYAAGQYGASVSGLYASRGYHEWSIGDLTAQLGQGRPVLLLVRYWDLPGHETSSFAGDHYIVALGVDGAGNIVYNDPAFGDASGSERSISPAKLTTAWSETSAGLVRTAMSVYK
jgi:LysM repeat protein